MGKNKSGKTKTPGRICVFDVSRGGPGSVLVEADTGGMTVDLVATNGIERWEGHLKYGDITSLLADHAPVTRSEWEFILEAIFDQTQGPDIVVEATIIPKEALILTVRKRTGGITQRLGTITLAYDIDGATDVVAWCATAARSAAKASSRVLETNNEISELKSEVNDLKNQLRDLLTAKEEDELVLLRKFRDLLNEKKVKIREQHKIISSASFKMAHLTTDDAESSQAPPPASQSSAPSRGTKRKATRRPVQGSSEDDGFDTMDVDVKIKDEPLDDEDLEPEQGSTASEQETASEDDDDEDEGEAQVAPSNVSGTGTGGQPKQVNKPPPPRSLPFGSRQRSETSAQTPNTVGTMAGSDTSDDEL